MTGKQEIPKSQFNARADSAAQALRKTLQQRGANIPDSRTVEVDANGRTPAPLPPEGSYARMAIERQRGAAASMRAEQLVESDDIEIQRQDPQATLEGDQAGSRPGTQPPLVESAQPSANAQRRISELTESLRRKDQELQQISEDGKKSKTTLDEMQAAMAQLQQQHRQLLETSLDNMDPDTRTQVLLDGRLHEAIAASERRLMDQILPHLSKIDQHAADAEMRRLSTVYPGFSIDLHGPLIEAFRRKNPHCTVDQAFRAVAEPEELQLAPQVRASAVPPIVQPGNGRAPSRYAVVEQKDDPDADLREEARKLYAMMRSDDPADKAGRDRAMQNHLAKRLGRTLPQ